MVEDDKGSERPEGQERQTGNNAGSGDDASKSQRNKPVPRPWHKDDEKERSVSQPAATIPDSTGISQDDDALNDEALAAATPQRQAHVPRPWHQSLGTKQRRSETSEEPHARGNDDASGPVNRSTQRGPTPHGERKRARRRPPAAAEPQRRSVPPPSRATKRRRPKRMVLVAFLVAILVVIGAVLFAGPWLSFRATGAVGARAYRLAPSDATTVAAVNVRSGQHVRAGDVLITLNDPQLAQKLAHLKAQIAQATSHQDSAAKTDGSKQQVAALRATIAQLRSNLRDLGHRYANAQARAQQLRAQTQNEPVTPEMLQQANEAVRQTKGQYHDEAAKLRADEGKLKKLESASAGSQSAQKLAALKQARDHLSARLHTLQLQAPVDGVITNIAARQGQTLSAGETAVTEVPSNDHRALLYFPHAARSHLSDGKTLSVKSPGGGTVKMSIDRIFASPKDMPSNLRHLPGQRASAVVVLAHAVNAQQAAHLAPGTAVSAHVPRW